MKLAKGWAFPDADEFMVSELKDDGTYQLSNLEAALDFVTDYSCAIDGGAHIGTWSKVMARSFGQVVAVEPSDDTAECLAVNMQAVQNVTILRCALGDRAGLAALTLDPTNAKRKNTGARHLQTGRDVRVETIDSWALPSVGFIKLDIEGSELAALKGAKDTLQRCHPVVLFEDKGLGHRYYGEPRQAIQHWLSAHGYRHLSRSSCDEIWGYRR